MNPQLSLWSDRPLTTAIAAFVCYAGVFNDVIGVEELASRLGVSGQNDFYRALDDLHRQRRVILQDGYAGLPGLENQIGIKASKIATARGLIQSRLASLHKVGQSPIVEFVGISGSLAAGNPVRDRNRRLDLDVFLITRHPYLWLYRILLGFRRLVPWREPEPVLCINYLMDTSHLMVMNRNFYTATEIWNLIPVSGFDTYRKFLRANRWVRHYYPGFSVASAPATLNPAGHLANKSFFLLYAMLRSVKWMNLSILKKVSFKTDLHRGTGLNLCGAPYGGYQALVLKKFSRLAEARFPDLLDAELIDKLFPDEFSVEIKRGDIDVPGLLANAGLGFDYSKYA